jgi:hypothetical protein
VARVNENKNAHNVLTGRPKGFRPLGIANCRWEGSIKIGMKERTKFLSGNLKD